MDPFLGLQVDDDDELTPRLTIGGALRALRVDVAEQAEDVFAVTSTLYCRG